MLFVLHQRTFLTLYQLTERKKRNESIFFKNNNVQKGDRIRLKIHLIGEAYYWFFDSFLFYPRDKKTISK
jgi:hypothetical protein